MTQKLGGVYICSCKLCYFAYPPPPRLFLPPSLNMIFAFIPVQGDNVISVSIFGFPLISPYICSYCFRKQDGKSQIFQPFL